MLIPMCKSGQLTFLKAGIIYMHFGVLLIVFKVNKDPRTKTVGPSKNLEKIKKMQVVYVIEIISQKIWLNRLLIRGDNETTWLTGDS